jgi:PAS domain S-box-containing protein
MLLAVVCGIGLLSARAAGAQDRPPPALFLGNAALPPLCFLEHGQPRGLVVDLATALATHMRRPVDVRLMDWADAQQRVQQGRADALLQMNPSPERRLRYDFSDPLLRTEFMIFTDADRPDIAGLRDLRGLRVCVERKGLAIQLLQADPAIVITQVPNLAEGFALLAHGKVDAVIADRWAGAYLLARDRIGGVRIVRAPVARSESAIAVRKGDVALLVDINTALAALRQSGEYDAILARWQPKEVVFTTREQVGRQAWVTAGISLLLLAALVSMLFLLREIRRRRRVEEALRESELRFRQVVEHTTAIILRVRPDGIITYANTRALDFFGYTAKELIGRHAVGTVVPEVETTGRDLAAMIDGICADPDRYHSNANENMRKNGERVWLEWTNSGIVDADGTMKEFLAVGIDITARTQVEEALHNSEAQLRLFIEHAPAALAMFDRDMRYLAASRRWLDDYGLEHRDMRGLSHYEIFPEIGEEWRAVHARGLAGEVVCAEEDPFVRQDGTTQWLRWEVRPWHDATGAVGGIVIFTEDITERRQAEAALRASEEKYRSIVETAQEGILIGDLEGRILFVNARFASMLGYAPEELLGRVGIEFLENTPFEQVQETRRQLDDGAPAQLECCFRRKDGSRLWTLVAVTPLTDAAGTHIANLAMHADITERKQAEAALRREQALLQAVIDGATNAHLVYLDRNFNFVRVNETYARTCGYTPEAMIGLNHFDLYPDAENEAIFTRVRETGVPMAYHDKPFEFPDQPERGITYWDWTLHPVADGSGAVAGLIFALTETTDRVLAEQERAAMQERQRTFLHMVSHDLRVPLTIILGHTDLLSEQLAGEDADPLTRRGVEAVNRAAARMNVMIEDLVDAARIEGGQLTLHRRPLALEVYVPEILQGLAAGLDISRVSLTVDADLPAVEADPDRLGRIVSNLVSNALKYSAPDTPVAVRVAREDAMVTIAVTDHGRGIDPDDLPHLFGRFFRARGERRAEGIGLGLYITRLLAEAHGGTVRVDSTPGQGSTFTVVLPAS